MESRWKPTFCAPAGWADTITTGVRGRGRPSRTRSPARVLRQFAAAGRAHELPLRPSTIPDGDTNSAGVWQTYHRKNQPSRTREGFDVSRVRTTHRGVRTETTSTEAFCVVARSEGGNLWVTSSELKLQRQLDRARPADLVQGIDATALAAATEIVVQHLRGLCELR